MNFIEFQARKCLEEFKTRIPKMERREFDRKPYLEQVRLAMSNYALSCGHKEHLAKVREEAEQMGLPNSGLVVAAYVNMVWMVASFVIPDATRIDNVKVRPICLEPVDILPLLKQGDS